MLNRGFLLLIACMLVFTVACGQDSGTGGSGEGSATTDTATGLPGGHPAIDSGGIGSTPTNHGTTTGTKEVRISDEVKAKWKVIEVEISDKKSAAKKVLKLEVGKKTALKDTNFKVLVVAFAPHYRIYEDYVGSASNELNNPAVLMELFDGDNSVAKGWIFKKVEFKTFNSFIHDNYAIALLEQKG